MRRLAVLSVLLVAAAAVVAAAPTYRWVDADGVVHYSDQPHPGAEKYTLQQAQTYSGGPAPPAPRAPATQQQPAAGADASYHYQRCAITQPATDEVLYEDAVDVRASLVPDARAGDHVILQFDSAAMEAPAPGQLEFRIEPVERGSHTVALLVRDGAGRTLCQSAPVTFHRREASQLAPQNPNNPARHKR